MGEFSICNDNNSNATLIPNQFIDFYMADANEAQIKTYLYLVRMMSAGRSTSISQMADAFNHTEKEIVRSLKYWERNGLINLEIDDNGVLCAVHLCDLQQGAAVSGRSIRKAARDGRVNIAQGSFTVSQQAAASISSQKAQAGQKTAQATSMTPPQVMDDSRKRAELFFIVEQYIGKPLSASEMQKINYIADGLHFSDDLIDFLVQYCVGNGKKDFRYIEKVAINWAEDGISTTAQAQENVARRPQRSLQMAGQTAGSASSYASASPAVMAGSGGSGSQGSQTGASPVCRNGRKGSKSSNSFNRFHQNEYDFEELEKQLLEG